MIKDIRITSIEHHHAEFSVGGSPNTHYWPTGMTVGGTAVTERASIEFSISIREGARIDSESLENFIKEELSL